MFIFGARMSYLVGKQSSWSFIFGLSIFFLFSVVV